MLQSTSFNTLRCAVSLKYIPDSQESKQYKGFSLNVKNHINSHWNDNYLISKIWPG